MLQLQPKLAEWKQQGIDLYVVTAGSESDLKKFFEGRKIEATIVYDPALDVVKQYGVSGIPHTFFVDKAGRVAFDSLGWMDQWLDTKFVPVLTALLEE